MVSRALAQVDDLRRALIDGLEQTESALLASPLPISAESIDRAEDRIVGFVREALPGAAAGASMVLEVLAGIALAVFVLFFLLKDGDRMWRWVLSWVPGGHRERIGAAGHRAWDTVTAYTRGTTVVALIDAAGIGAAMFVLGVPLAASLTVIVFIGAYAPIVGATVSGALAVAVTFVTLGPVEAAVLLGVVLLVQQVEGNLLQPLIMGKVLQLHPVVVVVAVATGTVTAGILGAIVAVPLVAVVAVVYRVVDLLADRGSASRPSIR